ncbi:hypothetical protein [Brevundimonas sp. Root1423]|uniref:hypothetical protein n=1 Tax=Brevundimonas sp. Root1423 TaxID=1736462 RepID=UPI0006F3DE37|nr:hypothetical protein [Brevundimonas sp. Root1423]KQY96702.1 hypothetical protein ASD25_02400 [Brevundimonas sp. Root1423]
MFAILAGLTLIAAQNAPEATPRDWLDKDPLVKFAPDSRMETPTPMGSWTGRAFMTITCVVGESGALDDCRMLRETPTGRINARTAIRAFRHARLDLSDPAGPRPGDTVTTELILNRAWLRR